jgi:uncharacterized membrane protein YoaK (UPF0700 family)
MIHLETVNEIYLPKNIVIWLISAFKAGFINSAGFLASGMFVSHITGFGTKVGIALGNENYFFSLELLIIPFFFIMGGVLTSIILDRTYKKNEVPPYYAVQGLITVLIAAVVLMGNERVFNSNSEFGPREFILMGLLCLICGLKNSLIAWSTFGRIKVTHLTGLSTDIGLNLVRTFYKKQPAPRFKESRIINITRFLTLFSFTAGAGISALIFPVVGFKGFYLVLFISLGMTLYSLYHSRQFVQRKLHPMVDPVNSLR